jgi:hypothetical protein
MGELVAGWIDPRTQRATAFYFLLGILGSRIFHNGLDQWSFAGLVLMAGLGTLSGLAGIAKRFQTPPDPPGGQG